MKAITEKGMELGSDIAIAATMSTRIKGLLGKHGLAQGEGLLIQPCMSIHTFFMKFPIDAVFLDKNSRIVAMFRDLQPNRLTPVFLKAKSVLELPAGALGPEITVGEKITLS